MKTYEEMERDSIRDYPYSVFHPESDDPPPKFRTWREALDAQVRWNKLVPGHKAFKRRPLSGRSKIVNPFGDKPLRLREAGAVDLKDNHQEITHPSGYVETKAIDPSRKLTLPF